MHFYWTFCSVLPDFVLTIAKFFQRSNNRYPRVWVKKDQNSRFHTIHRSPIAWILIDFPKAASSFSFGANQSKFWFYFGHFVENPKSFQNVRNLEEQIRKTYLIGSNFMSKNVMAHGTWSSSSLPWVIWASEKTTQKSSKFKSVDFMSF